MKRQFTRIVLTAGLTILGSLTLSAQNLREAAKIPFAFQANQTSFAAGDYQIAEASTSGLFQLTNKAGGSSIFVNAPPVLESKGPAEAHLTFACYGHDCVLSQIWLPGSNVGYVRAESAVERDLNRKLGMATMIHVRLTAAH